MTPVAAYFTATTQAEIDAAEAHVLASSTGIVVHGGTIAARARDRPARWYGELAPVPGGLCCPRLFGASDAAHIAHLALATAVPHPGCGGTTRIVPVIALRDRPPVWADGVAGEAPGNLLYRALLRANHFLGLVLASPDHHDQLAELTDAVTTMLARIHAGWTSHAWPTSRTWTVWTPGEERASPSSPSVAPPRQRPPYDPAGVGGLRVFADGSGLFAFARTIVRFRTRDGKVLRVVPYEGTYLAAPTPALALVQAFGLEGRDEEQERVYALDLATGRWTDRPAEPAPVWFAESQERSLLLDTDGRQLPLDVGDYPVINEPSPDHRFIWVEDKHGDGGIFRLRDGALVRPPAAAPDELTGIPHLELDGRVVPRARYQPSPRHTRAAFVLGAHDRWRTLREGVVREDGDPLLTLAGGSKLAAFGDDGLLWIADGKEVRAIDLAGIPRVRHRWAYQPLRKAAKAPARSTARAHERRAMGR